jgi:hypothetical protein
MSMGGFSSVYRDGVSLLVRGSVMELMGLLDGQSISDEQAWKIIELNAAAFVADMDLRRAAGEADIPDCSELKAQLARIAAGKS